MQPAKNIPTTSFKSLSFSKKKNPNFQFSKAFKLISYFDLIMSYNYKKLTILNLLRQVIYEQRQSV